MLSQSTLPLVMGQMERRNSPFLWRQINDTHLPLSFRVAFMIGHQHQITYPFRVAATSLEVIGDLRVFHAEFSKKKFILIDRNQISAIVN